jgi:2',3'-cyclic-nucleotide 2'-phosphodiesterase (5'-nucleotidase family)
MNRFFIPSIFMILSIQPAFTSGSDIPLTVLFTGSTNGLLQPCHCPGQPWGGLSRRKTLVDSLRRANPNTIFVDTGNWLSSYDRHEDDALLAQAYHLLDYDAVNLGVHELIYGVSWIGKAATDLPIVSANLEFNDHADEKLSKPIPIAPPYRIHQAGGMKILISGFLSPFFLSDLKDSVRVQTDIRPVIETLDGLKSAADSVDWVLILSQLTEDENRTIATRCSWIGAILGNGTREDPYGRWESSGKAVLAKAGLDGGTVGRLKVRLIDGKIRIDGVDFLPVDDHLKDDPDMVRLIGSLDGLEEP